MISRCSRPKNPQRKPKPSAAEDSISNEKEASLRRNRPIGRAQVLEVGGIDRKQAAEYHRLRRFEAGEARVVVRGGARP